MRTKPTQPSLTFEDRPDRFSFMRRALLCFVLTLTGFTAACSANSTPSANPKATALLAQVRAAIQRAGSVRFSDVTTIGTQSQTITGAFSATASTEELAGTSNSYVSVRVNGTQAWVKTNSVDSLTQVLGLPQATAPDYKDRWIALSSTDSAYATIVQTMTIATVVDVYLPTVTTAQIGAPLTIAGVATLALTATSKESSGLKTTSTMYVDATTKLPVLGTMVASQNKTAESKHCGFLDWGATISVEAPPGAVTLASILG